MTQRPTPPVAEQRPTIYKRHGISSTDEYAWLRDPNWAQVMRDPSALDPAIRSYLEAENEYTDSVLAETGNLRQSLLDEMRGRIKEDDSSVPATHGPWEYYRRFRVGGQYPLICRRAENAETVLFDGDEEAEGKEFFRISGAFHSPDHNRLAIGVDENGSEFYSITVRDLGTGANLPDTIIETSGSVVWTLDSAAFFYVRLDSSNRPRWVYLHRVGDDSRDDRLVYTEEDPGFYVGIETTESGNLAIIDSRDHETSEVRIIDLTDDGLNPQLIKLRSNGVLYEIHENEGHIVMLTNADGADDFSVRSKNGSWHDLIPHRPGIFINQILLFPSHLVRLETEAALPRIAIHDLSSGEERSIEFEEAAYSLALHPLLEYNRTLRFSYSSPATPLRTIDYDLATGIQEIRKQQEVPSGHDPDDYRVERRFAIAEDGTNIPYTLLYRRSTRLDGTAPCVLYGYGSYGMSMPASFTTGRLSLVDRGFVYVIAHVRGGMEGGYRWYRTGKRNHKMNTFTDFITVAEAIVDSEVSSRGRIVAWGGSAGGLLVGATLNLVPPGLLGGAIAQVPFVDVVTTMYDTDLPLTPMEWPEWGNPIESIDDFQYIKSYSPYDNVSERPYPPTMVTAGLTDPRVTYWEPAKWVARLRKLRSDDNPLLLRTHMGAGHAGASGRFDALWEQAEVTAFTIEIMDAH